MPEPGTFPIHTQISKTKHELKTTGDIQSRKILQALGQNGPVSTLILLLIVSLCGRVTVCFEIKARTVSFVSTPGVGTKRVILLFVLNHQTGFTGTKRVV